MKTLYSILGLDQGASISSIESAYERMRAEFPPERLSVDADARAQFQGIEMAYKTLSDSNAKSVYDLKLKATPQPAKPAKADDDEFDDIEDEERAKTMKMVKIGVIGLIIAIIVGAGFMQAKASKAKKAVEEKSSAAEYIIKMLEGGLIVALP